MADRHKLTWGVGPKISAKPLPDGVERMFIPSPDGMLELLVALPAGTGSGSGEERPPLLFVHGGEESFLLSQLLYIMEVSLW